MKLLSKTDIRKDRFNIVLLACCAIFYFLLPLSGNIVYSTADDYMYILITSGAYTGTPSPYTIFEGYLYSSLIASLYKLTNQLEWFSIVQHFLGVLSFVVISWYLFKSKLKSSLVYCFYSVIFVAQLYVLLSPNFTLSAAELSFASLVVLLNNRGNIKYEMFALLLFLVGSEIRFLAVFLPLMVLFPIFMYSQEKKFYISKQFLHTSFFLCCMVIGAIILKVYSNNIYNSDSNWKYFFEYNNARGYLNDNPRANDAIKIFDDDNKKEEYNLLINYRVNDGNIVTAGELNKCADFIKGSFFESISHNIISYILMIIQIGGIFAFFILIFLVYEMLRGREYWLCAIAAWGIISVAFACLFMASSSVAKLRTIMPLIFAQYFLMVWCSYRIKKKYFNYLWMFFCLFGVLRLGFWTKAIYKDNANAISGIEEVNHFLMTVPMPKLLVHTKIPIRGEAFHYSQSPIAKKLVRAGWLTNSPITKIHYDGFLSYTKGLPYFYNKSQEKYVEKIQSLLGSYYGIKTQRVVISEYEDYVIEKMMVSPTD